MAERRPFLLRVEPELLEALALWARDDLRSLNGQIEFILRRALRDAGRAGEGGKGGDAAPRRDRGGKP